MQNQEATHSNTYSRLLPMTALSVALVLVAMLAITLWHLRVNTLESHSRELKVLALTMSDEVYRGLQGVEGGMRAIGLELAQDRMAAAAPGTALALRTRIGLMPQVRSLWLVDGAGRVLSASNDLPMPDLRELAMVPSPIATDTAVISRPFAGTGPEVSVALAVPFVAGARRQVSGWIVAAMPASMLLGAFTAASQAPDARIAMFRGDGVRLSGTIVATPTLDETSRAKRLATAKSLELRRFSDGTERIVSITNLPRYDLKLMLTRDWDAVLSSWHEFARISILGVLLILAVIAASVFTVQRASREQAQLQQSLQTARSRASRLESLGALAGGVAHDFNNVLAAIMGFAEMARDSASDGSRQARHLDHVLEGTQRGKALVERILAFSRGGAKMSLVFELEPVIEDVLGLLVATLPSTVIVERRFEAPGARLRGDPTQIFEAVMNLCTNALQAMPCGGMLTVGLHREQVAKIRPLSHAQLPSGQYVVLRVTDQGSGITPEVMEHLFEPFFTTRGSASGTGLGLAVVFGAMSEINGAIDVQSTPGHGASFTLYLPESFDQLSPAPDALPSHQRGHGETIMIIDDDPELVALNEDSLCDLGYNPVGFTDPAAALRAYHEAPNRFAALITDEAMPGLSGTAIAEGVRRVSADVPILLVSGYGGTALASRAAAAGVSRVLAKPLKRADLALALAELMHKAPLP